MLHDFLIANHEELIVRCKVKAGERRGPFTTDRESEYGVPTFLNQLAAVLRDEHAAGQSNSQVTSDTSRVDQTADDHGKELMLKGISVDQVVHLYGDVCQAVTELAMETHEPITVTEFHVFNRCLDNAIAHAVSRFASARERFIVDTGERTLNESLGFLAHELRNLIQTAMLAVNILKQNGEFMSGPTSAVLDRSLKGLMVLASQTLIDVRLNAGMEPLPKRVLVSELIEDIRVASAMDAQARNVRLVVMDVEVGLAVEVHHHILAAAVANLLQNAFKFTKPNGAVWLRAYSGLDRVLIEVEDECGGLRVEDPEDLFRLFSQKNDDRTGTGLGLGFSRRAVESNGGSLMVSNLPGAGCIFTIDLPKK